MKITYGPHGATIVAKQAHDGDVALIRLTDAEIDRIVAARDEYHRETKHRGYPVKG